MRLLVVSAASVLLGGLAVLAPRPAGAAPADRGIDYVIVDPDPRSAARDASGPDTLFLNRCAGGCTVTSGGNDARTNQSSIPTSTSTLSPFMYSDTIWDAVVACVTDTYRPYGVDVVTVEPASGDYVEVMVAGSPDELGLGPNTLGIAPMAGNCAPQVNWIAFAFANIHGSDPVLELCATVAHEAGHVYGLDHEYECKDPMTYLTGCGQKWFLNVNAQCGEFDGPRACRCGDTQNSHVKLTGALGAGTLPPPPEVTVLYPSDGAMVSSGFSLIGEVVEPRIVDRVEFWLNGWPWRTVDGLRDETNYSFVAPGEVPDGIIDVEIRAYNDLELMGSATITVTKGAPCTTAESCLDGQFCDAGRCMWPEPTGVLGEACARDADCISRKCASDGELSLCTELCTPGIDGACDDGYECLTSGDQGLCWPEGLDEGGCCSAGGGGLGPTMLGLGVLGLALRRRRAS